MQGGQVPIQPARGFVLWGHVVDGHGRRPEPKKLQQLTHWPELKTKDDYFQHDLENQSFLCYEKCILGS